MTDPQSELESLRKLLQEALSDAADGAVSQGALELRRKFSAALMAARDKEAELKTARTLKPGDLQQPYKQREGD